ncbi:MAG: DUF3783 domain-containing protein, partial [Clostridiales bacterium]|nr:DUF3783 domain-containing protein [Clostridiales bacterium]
IADICKSQEIRASQVLPADYRQPLGYLAKIKGFTREKAFYRGDKFPDEMMVFSGIDSESLDRFLDAYRASGAVPIDRKAVLPLHNINWTPKQLFAELTKEHQAMQHNP